MGKFAFSTGTRAVNKVVICQRCNTNKKLAIDNYCVYCGIAVLSGEPKALKTARPISTAAKSYQDTPLNRLISSAEHENGAEVVAGGSASGKGVSVENEWASDDWTAVQLFLEGVEGV